MLYGMCTYVLFVVVCRMLMCRRVLLSVVGCVTLVVRRVSFIVCHVSFVVCWLLCVGCFLLVVGRWSLFVVGCVYVV